jgi:hypothetical protein
MMQFEPIIEPVTYCNGRKAWTWRVLFRDDAGEPVGVTSQYRGRQRTEAPSRRAALKAAKAEIGRVRHHRLFLIRVTREDIANGTGRSIHDCPVAQALYREKETMGLDKWRHGFRVETYACFIDADGLVLTDRDGTEHAIDPPDVVFPCKNERGWCAESMMEWTMLFDDWYDSQGVTAREWRREHDGDGKPGKMWPVSFVLDLDELLVAES